MKLKRIVGALSLLGLATHAVAQTAPPQRVEITGSSIKRIAAEGALPVEIITRKELERQGIATAEQLIMQLNINGNGVDNLASNSDVAAGSSRGNNGLSAANLRMQGAAATLVLLNGRRVAVAGLSGGVVDLQQIPFSAVERVEILKDGASSLYGTDAIGGVINFITRKDYTGLQVQGLADIDQHPGGNIYKASITGGIGNLDTDGFNVLAVLAHAENKALNGSQRDFVNTYQANRGVSPDTTGSPYATVVPITTLYNALSRDNLSATGRGTGPVAPGGGTQTYNRINVLNLPGQAGCNSIPLMGAYDYLLWSSPASKYGCSWDTGKAAVIQQPVKNDNFLARGTFRLGAHELFAEVTAGQVKTQKSFSPNQISSSTTATSPFFNLAYPSTGAAYAGVFNAILAPSRPWRPTPASRCPSAGAACPAATARSAPPPTPRVSWSVPKGRWALTTGSTRPPSAARPATPSPSSTTATSTACPSRRCSTTARSTPSRPTASRRRRRRWRRWTACAPTASRCMAASPPSPGSMAPSPARCSSCRAVTCRPRWASTCAPRSTASTAMPPTWRRRTRSSTRLSTA
jgi:hypothetical protein